MIDLRFPTALQMVLGIALADRNGIRCTSRTLAEGLASNPSFIRKLLIPLALDGMIATTPGKGGGLHLGRPASEITLRQIYQAATAEKRLLPARQDIPCFCVISSNINDFFSEVSNDIEQSLHASLEKITVEYSLERIIHFELLRNSSF